ncbi:MAG: hypothetical protein P4L79_13870 [Legionella sp.]|uniref:hypothetical protein n=1 Tax=Legionella sp. TaxID=459 RepID=UPI0028440CCB|nr:hypothetical protein [Legionella sp.]
MFNIFLQLILALTFIAVLCFATYKVTVLLGAKLIDLTFKSINFCRGVCVFLALCFFLVGVLSYQDFITQTGPDLSRFFPLFCVCGGFFLFLSLRVRQMSSVHCDKVVHDTLSQWEGWIEIVNTNYHSLLFGKILYRTDGIAVGVGVLVKEYLPPLLFSDIVEKIKPQFLDGHGPICRFCIDFLGQDVNYTEFKDIELREKLRPYMSEHSKIKLLVGLNSNEFVLIDNKEGEKDFD